MACTSVSVNSNPWRRWWSLATDIHFYNHGSFGACPCPLLERQQQWRAQMEQEPVRFMLEELPAALLAARARMAEFVGCQANDLVVVTNATTAVNTVLHNIRWRSGDQLLITNQGYPACNFAAAMIAQQAAIELVTADIPFPLQTPQQVIDAVLAKITPRTRLVMLDHVTSATGLRLPVEELVPQLTARGIEVLIDGAHAPGMLPLNLAELGASYYTGNCHKWLCGPKSSAFLYVDRRHQAGFHPLVLSHGLSADTTNRFLAEFEWQGTIDPSPFLTAVQALDFFAEQVGGGWETIYRHNHELACEVQQCLSTLLDIPAPAPVSMLGSLCSVPIPATWIAASDAQAGSTFSRQLLRHAQIEIPFFANPATPGWLMRASCPLYLELADFDPLFDWVVQQIHR